MALVIGLDIKDIPPEEIPLFKDAEIKITLPNGKVIVQQIINVSEDYGNHTYVAYTK